MEQPQEPTSPAGDGAGAAGAPRSPSTAVVRPVRQPLPRLPRVVEGSVDVALGAAVTVARPVVGITASLVRAFAPLAQDAATLVARPPLVPEPLTLGHWADRFADRGAAVRQAAGGDVEVLTGQTLDVAIPTVLDPVLDRIDLTSLVIQRIDFERLVTAVLDRMDLTDVVLERVDLQRVVTAVLDGMDLTELVRSRVDLAGIAEDVIEEVDLPEIIRGSTTGVAADVVDGGRLAAMSGDEIVNRLVDRLLLRRRARATAARGWTGTDDDDVPGLLTRALGDDPGSVADGSASGGSASEAAASGEAVSGQTGTSAQGRESGTPPAEQRTAPSPSPSASSSATSSASSPSGEVAP